MTEPAIPDPKVTITPTGEALADRLKDITAPGWPTLTKAAKPDLVDTTGLREYGTDEQVAALYMALAKAKLAFKPVPKDHTGQSGHQKFQYAPLATLQACTQQALAENGLSVIQPMSCVEGQGCIRTILVHESGGRLVGEWHFTPAQLIKEVGSQSTYFARYAYQRLLCLDSGDDADAQGTNAEPAGAAKTKPKPSKPASKPAEKPAKRQRAQHTKDVSQAQQSLADAGVSKPKEPEEETAPISPSMTPETSNAIKAEAERSGTWGAGMADLCKQITGIIPKDMSQPGGEAKALKFLAHLKGLPDAS